ncbi:lysine biosynthesis protein LysW [Deinococcus metallilatus]|uniref:Alpha-aminoadipate carrier protein LysW n=1 Tax=Deinococcus metallilatus TaxID=1211322 RepID=A0AAJ5F3D1_9DEIO|nr:lysine biosynthesis protein LysW [Deinococcus metallilatus]MBB5294151.1 alpha-aminoadipate carrier protein LysW [Deinococcus metallilatus]QBY08933.1 lysine biosynthesis protein LysW [Deinococcus metallilatus]RXJ10077.1 lysine biosynthesis protein LysW [Deinococcus metallilatus]TLK27986.1 lysine biosynthesis protein LysW [Deinococcus metallilatus]GMA16512.1 alpha-aminoadipate carrier protein LysW [Deinococcus metallilatus]
MSIIQFENPETGAIIELTDPELGELVIDDETGVEYEVVSVDPPRLELAPQEAEDWGE